MNHTSAVLILPIEKKGAGDAVAGAQGWGEIAYTIHLSNDGGETVTHIGCRADVSDDFPVMLAVAAGQMTMPDPPPAWAAGLASINPGDLASVVGSLIWHFSPDPSDPESLPLYGRDHLDAVLAAQGLVEVSL